MTTSVVLVILLGLAIACGLAAVIERNRAVAECVFLRTHIEALEKAICEELCECGSFDNPAKDEHDDDCPYFKFVAALAAKEETHG